MKKTLLTAALALPFCSAHAVENLSWTQASVSYVSANISDTYDFSGLAFSGTKLLDDNVFLSGRFESTSEDIISSGTTYTLGLRRVSLGLGYRQATSDSTDVFGKVTYENYTVSASSPYSGYTIESSDSTTGYGLEGGIRSLVTPKLELGASISRISLEGESETAINLLGNYHISDVHSIGLATSSFDDTSFTEFKWAYSFR